MDLSVHTSEAVRHSHVLAIVLTEQHTNHSPLRLVLDCAIIVVDSGKKDERSDRYVARYEGERLGGCGRHRGRFAQRPECGRVGQTCGWHEAAELLKRARSVWAKIGGAEVRCTVAIGTQCVRAVCSCAR